MQSGLRIILRPILKIAVYLSRNAKDLVKSFNPLAPERCRIPSLDLVEPFDLKIEEVAKDAILSYGIHSLLANRLEVMAELEITLSNGLEGPFPGKKIFTHWKEQADACSGLDKEVIEILRAISRNEHLTPYRFWLSGLRLFEWINRSRFKDFLTPKLSAWQRSGWRRILTKERFALSRPMLSVPPIEQVLNNSRRR